MKKLPQRLLSKINKTDTCWIWTAYIRPMGPQGYGGSSLNGRPEDAHRVVYKILVGPIPEGLELDHTCHNSLCVNPEHLEPVTHAENLRRMREWQLLQKHIGMDHEPVRGGGYRKAACDICDKRYRKEYDRKRAEAGYWKMAPEDIQPRVYKSKTGHTGISPLPTGKYQAYVDKNGKRVYLGVYATIEDAIKARDEYMVNMQI